MSSSKKEGKKKKRKGPEAFHRYYKKIYGERWDTLVKALEDEPVYATLSEGLLQPYYLDEASLWPAHSLGIQPGDSVLDMCAAPGGKSLVMVLALKGRGSLISNDRSPTRRGRLKRVMDQHLPPDIRPMVTVTGHDATKWNQHEKAVYDRILLDAPCSSERHWLHDPSYMKDWTPGRTRSLAVKQFAMLASALDALKPGGTLVYSTCALSPEENDGNMAKLLKKRRGLFEFDLPECPGADRTTYGIHLLPTSDKARGPIFFSRVVKNI